MHHRCLRTWARNWWVWSRGDKPALAKETAAEAANSGLTSGFPLHLAVPQKYGHKRGAVRGGWLDRGVRLYLTWEDEISGLESG